MIGGGPPAASGAAHYTQEGAGAGWGEGPSPWKGPEAFWSVNPVTGPDGGKGGKGKGYAFLPGDWKCPKCGDHQFAKNTECRKCGASGGKR